MKNLACFFCLTTLFITSCHPKPAAPPEPLGPLITTVAGNGTLGNPIDGTLAIVNPIFPGALEIDKNDDLLVVSGNILYKINNAGVIEKMAGTGTLGYSGDGGDAKAAQFRSIGDIAVDDKGNIYISDGEDGRIRKINTSGIITTIAGNGGSGYNGDNIPSTSALLNGPGGMVVDHNGNIYFADLNNFRIRKIDTFGIIHTIGGNGLEGYSGDGEMATNAKLGYNTAITIDNLGNLYFTDPIYVHKIDALGIVTTVAGKGNDTGNGVVAISAKINFGFLNGDITVSNNEIFIAESDNQKIRKINSQGIISTVAGNGYKKYVGMGQYQGGYNGDNITATHAALNFPVSLAVNSKGEVYISDARNNRVRKVSNK